MARDLDGRIFRFACRIVEIFGTLYRQPGAAGPIAYQLVKAGTSVGANYEEASAGQSKKDFIAKLSIVRKELFETRFWLRLLVATQQPACAELAADLDEVGQLIAIVTAIIRKAKSSPNRGSEET
jgi:four helix bundle protein